ncbi:MAG: hypothetical protein AB7H97_03940 [Pseudobdellovibrionaceae bacterium]
MKKTMYFILTIVSVMALASGCGKKKSGGSKQVAVTPATTATTVCIQNPQQPGCEPTGWSQYGAYPYPYQNGYYTGYEISFKNGFCSCGNGQRPMYHQTWGLGCVGAGVFNPNWQVYGWPADNGQYLTTRQQSYQSNIAGQNGCYMDLYRACDTQYPSQCGGGICQSLNGGTRLGVCVYDGSFSAVMGVGGSW